jgi:hypothetical protein
MQISTFIHLPETGWSADALPALDSEQTLVLAFGAADLRLVEAPLADLLQAYPRSQVIGCSTAGEIYGTALTDESLVVAVARFEQTRLGLASAPAATPDDSFMAGEMIARALLRPDLRGVLVLSDGHNVNGSQLVGGLNSVLPESIVVTGGLAGDGDRFERTWVLHDGTPQSGYVSAVGFYGSHVHLGHGSKGGWDIFGIERRVTRSEGNILYELDGRPALQLYKEYLGDRADGLPATALLFPLALRADAADAKRIVRTVLDIDEARDAMIFAGDIPEGSLAQLMQANFDRLVDGAAEAALMTHTNDHAEGPLLSVAISCVGRRLVLGERSEEELEATLEVLPEHAHQVGFYSYGEISPYATGHCDLHNQTMTLTTIREG